MRFSLRFLFPLFLVACIGCGQKEEQVVATQLVGAWQSSERAYELRADHTFSMSWSSPKGAVKVDGEWEVTAMGKAVLFNIKRWSSADPPPGPLMFFVESKSADDVVFGYKQDNSVKKELLHRVSSK